MKKSYQIICIWGGREYYTSIRTSPIPCRGRAFALAPVGGCPMRARDTLLATASEALLARHRKAAVLGCDDILAQALRHDRAAKRRRGNPSPAPSHKTPLAHPALVGRLVSVEVEFFPAQSARFPVDSPLVKTTRDASLSSSGREVQRTSWISDGRLRGVLSLADCLRGGTVNTSCGLHVHVDVRHLSADQRAATYDALVSLYPFLKKLVPKSRHRNRFCAWVNNRPGASGYRRPLNGERYAAVNWASTSRHGTIEFRCQGGSTDPLKIESWALLCQYLVSMASVPGFLPPRSWEQFLNRLPGWMSDWCRLRQLKLAGKITVIPTDRVTSGMR